MNTISNEILKKTPVFASLDGPSLSLIAGVMKKRVLEPGSILYTQGQPGDSMLIVSDGKLSVGYKRVTGREFQLGSVGPGEILGEMSCIDPAPRSATIVAEKLSTVYEMDRILVRSLYEHAPDIISKMFSGIASLILQRSSELEQHIIEYIDSLDAQHKNRVVEKTREDGMAPVSDRPHTQARLSLTDIRSLTLPKGFSTVDFETMLAAGTSFQYWKGNIICHEGDTAASCHLLLNGELHVFRKAGQGHRWLSTLHPGQFFGQLALITSNNRRSATIQVSKDALVLTVTRSDFNKLLNTHHPIGPKFQEHLVVTGIRQHRKTLEKIEYIHQLDTFAEPKTQHKTVPADTSQYSTDDITDILKDYLSSLKEWGVTPDSLKEVRLVHHSGELTQQEIKTRLRLKME